MIDRLWRQVLWIGFRLARLWWGVRRKLHHGALVAVWVDGRVLVVRQTYRRELTLPGGGIRPHETALEAACRELREETGLTASPGELRLVYDDTMRWDGRPDHVRIFALHLAAAPALRPDRREIEAAWFMAPKDVLAAPIPPFLRAYLRAEASAAA